MADVNIRINKHSMSFARRLMSIAVAFCTVGFVIDMYLNLTNQWCNQGDNQFKATKSVYFSMTFAGLIWAAVSAIIAGVYQLNRLFITTAEREGSLFKPLQDSLIAIGSSAQLMFSTLAKLSLLTNGIGSLIIHWQQTPECDQQQENYAKELFLTTTAAGTVLFTGASIAASMAKSCCGLTTVDVETDTNSEQQPRSSSILINGYGTVNTSGTDIPPPPYSAVVAQGYAYP